MTLFETLDCSETVAEVVEVVVDLACRKKRLFFCPNRSSAAEVVEVHPVARVDPVVEAVVVVVVVNSCTEE